MAATNVMVLYVLLMTLGFCSVLRTLMMLQFMSVQYFNRHWIGTLMSSYQPVLEYKNTEDSNLKNIEVMKL